MVVGLEQNCAVLWQIFSQVAKQGPTVTFTGDRKDAKALYNFHEAIVNTLRPTLKEGVKSIIVASPSRTSFANDFLGHIKTHHQWLFQGANKATFSQVTGLAGTKPQIAALTSTDQFKELIQQTAAQETENLLEILEKRLNTQDNLVLFSLPEAENVILNPQAPGRMQPEYLLLTDEYLANSRQKSRVNRLMQIAQNKKIKARVISAESNAGKRLTQLGGIVCLAKNA